MAEVINGGGSGGGGGSLPTDPSFTTVTTTGAISSGGDLTVSRDASATTVHANVTNTNATAGSTAQVNMTAGSRSALLQQTATGQFRIQSASASIQMATSVGDHCRFVNDNSLRFTAVASTPAGTAGQASLYCDSSGNPYVRVGTGKIIDIGALGLTATDVKTSAYTAAAGELVLVDPSAASADIAITLPATAAHCAVMLATNAASRWSVTVNRNGNTVNGLTDTSRFSMQFEGQLAQFRPGSSGYEGQVLNPPTVLRAYNFNATGTYEVAHNATLNPSSACSFDFWVYRATNVGNQYIWLNSNLSTTGTALAFTSGSDDLLFRDNSNWRTGPNIPVGEWVHVVAAYGSSDVTFYVNGVSRVSVAANASITAFTSAKFFGGASASTDRLIGAIWNFRQWASKISAGDAALLYGDGVPLIANPLGSSPVLWFRGQEARTSAVDISGNSFNGTLSGTVGVARAPRQLNF